MSNRRCVLLLIAILSLSACGGRGAGEQGPSVSASDAVAVVPTLASAIEAPAATTSPTSDPTKTPVATASPAPKPRPTSTSIPTRPPTATATAPATPTPTPTPLHPLAIEYLRQQDYPGSEIVIVDTLQPGTNYDRYIAAYRSEGLRIYAMLTVPRGQTPEGGWPAIIFNHGYIPPAQYRTTERYVAYVDALARSGYVVFRPDYRGHGKSEGEPASNYASPAYTIDVLNAVASVKRFPEANPEKIGMWGHSLGGGITLRAMVTTSDIKAGVIWAGTVASYPELLERRWDVGQGGSSSLPTLEPGSGRWSWVLEMLEAHGSPEENPAFYASISPNTYLGDLSGPVQLHHGTADTSVPVEYSEMLGAEVEAAGKPVDLFIYPGDDHNISANFGRAMARSISFFDTYVKGAPDN